MKKIGTDRISLKTKILLTKEDKVRFKECVDKYIKNVKDYVDNFCITEFGFEQQVQDDMIGIAENVFNIDMESLVTFATVDWINYQAYRLIDAISKEMKWTVSQDWIDLGKNMEKHKSIFF